jgi:hypothetical protein
MEGQTHIIDVDFFRIHIRQVDRFVIETEVVDAVVAPGDGKEGFPVGPFYSDGKVDLVFEEDGTGIEGGIDAQAFFEERIRLLVQVIPPLNRNRGGSQYRILEPFIDAVVEVGRMSSSWITASPVLLSALSYFSWIMLLV